MSSISEIARDARESATLTESRLDFFDCALIFIFILILVLSASVIYIKDFSTRVLNSNFTATNP